ncbi:MAG: repressor LexA [Parcubacteria group bacterium]|nr:repressor LexA [Parcubacteria group bacterium]
MTIILPNKKQQLLDFLKSYVKDRGYAPTLSEIAKKFKVSSLATVHEHMAFLEKHGFIKRTGNIQSRELEIVRSGSNVEPTFLEGSMHSLPLVGLITAGAPIEAVENREAEIAVPAEITRGRQCYMDGDLVIVEKTEYAKNGDMVVAVLDDGTATLKKFYKEKNYVRLQPANAKYQPLMVENVIIRGRVVGIIRKY